MIKIFFTLLSERWHLIQLCIQSRFESDYSLFIDDLKNLHSVWHIVHLK